MKTSRIPNFGSFGIYVDDIDMDHMTDEQWMEIGRLYVENLVLIFRDIKMSKIQYMDWMPKWGPLKSNSRIWLHNKYGPELDAIKPETWEKVDLEPQDRDWIEHRKYHFEDAGDGRMLSRIYGRKDEHGHALGYFSEGEVFWHSNECSTLTFSPAVSLLGWDAMKGSATGFLQTVDIYESLSEAERSEIDDMILVHRYEAGRVNENEKTDPGLALHMRLGFCPVDDAETPMTIVAPNGRKGLHYSMNTRAEIKGATQAESQAIFDRLDKLVFDQRYIYDHWYTDNRDLLIFDQSVTLHRRKGYHPDRKAFRMAFDISPLVDKPYLPWQSHPEFNQQYLKEMNQLCNIVQGDLKARCKLPELVV
jgi:alpha-ketoglutarate-dependent taurine dioxygenase